MSQILPFVVLVFLLILPVFGTSECIYELSGLELSVFEDPLYGNKNIDALEEAFFPTNDRESLSVDIQYIFSDNSNQSMALRWAWSPITLFIYPFDFKFLSLFTVRYPTGSCTVQIAVPLCTKVSKDEIKRLMRGFTQTIRGNVVNGYSSGGRKLDNHQTGYSIFLNTEDDAINKIYFALPLVGAFLSTVIPCLVALIMYTLKEKAAEQHSKDKGKAPSTQIVNVEEKQPLLTAATPDKYDTTADPAAENGTNCEPKNKTQSTVEGTAQSAKVQNVEEKQALECGCTVTLSILAIIIAFTEILHFGFGIAPHLKTEMGQPLTFCLAFAAFAIILAAHIILYLCMKCNKKKYYCKEMMTILGCQLLLFHAPFIFLGLWSLPYQATITIAMYLSVIIVVATGISLSRYMYLIKNECNITCSMSLIILTSILTATVVGLFAYVVIVVTHYFQSTDDISQAGQSQLFATLLSVAIPTISIVLLWKNYLRMCKMLKQWLQSHTTLPNP